MTSKKYNPEIDLLKFVFAVIVLLYHGKNIEAVGQNGLFLYGFTSVEFFFIISGYLMVKSSKKYGTENAGKSTISFVYNKVKPLYLYFFFAFLCSFAVREIVFFTDKGYTVFDLGKDALSSVGELLFLMKTGVKFGVEFNGPTWYIGSMLIGMAVLLPILIKHKEWFVNIGSIVIAVFFYGYSYHIKNHINYVDWAEFTTMAIIRAVAGLCLGCFICGLVERIQEKGIELTKFGKVLLSFVQLGLLFIILFIMQREGLNNFDYVCVVYIFFFCLIVLSGLTGIKNVLPQKLCAFLGDASLLLYLNHRYVTRALNLIEYDGTPEQALIIYVALTCLMSVICKIVVVICRAIWKKIMPKIKTHLIKQA